GISWWRGDKDRYNQSYISFQDSGAMSFISPDYISLSSNTGTRVIGRFDVSGEFYLQDSLTLVDGQLQSYSGDVNCGLMLSGRIGSEIRDHYITSHSSRGQLMIYPNRVSGENILTIRSHDNKRSYRNDFEINASGNIISMPTRNNEVTWS